MDTQSITPTIPEINFKRLIIKQGSFDILKQSKYFPQSQNHPLYDEQMQNFYKRLMQLKRRADKNDLYDVILKPDENINGNLGHLAIVSKDGREQDGFKIPFDELLRVKEFEPKNSYTAEDIPNIFLRWYKNLQISINNKKIIHKHVNLEDFLNIVYKRIESWVKNAEYLSDLSNLKEGSLNVRKN